MVAQCLSEDEGRANQEHHDEEFRTQLRVPGGTGQSFYKSPERSTFMETEVMRGISRVYHGCVRVLPGHVHGARPYPSG